MLQRSASPGEPVLAHVERYVITPKVGRGTPGRWCHLGAGRLRPHISIIPHQFWWAYRRAATVHIVAGLIWPQVTKVRAGFRTTRGQQAQTYAVSPCLGPAGVAVHAQIFAALDSHRNWLGFLHCLSYLEVKQNESNHREQPQTAHQKPRLCVHRVVRLKGKTQAGRSLERCRSRVGRPIRSVKEFVGKASNRNQDHTDKQNVGKPNVQTTPAAF